MKTRSSILILIFVIIGSCLCRKHKLDIRHDVRRYIALSTFGFYTGGILDVKLINFRVEKGKEKDVYGFSLDRTMSDAMNLYLDNHQDKCLLESPVTTQNDGAVILFKMDLENKLLRVSCSPNLKSIHIYSKQESIPAAYLSRSKVSDTLLFHPKQKRSVVPEEDPVDIDESVKPEISLTAKTEGLCSQLTLPITVVENNDLVYYNTNFVLFIATEQEEGLYNLYFHSCPNYHSPLLLLDFSMEIEEKNGSNFLSAGEMPLPALYFMMALLFFLSGCFWVFILKKSKHPVFKIHYLMAVLVYLKAMSLMFHGINFHFIETKGEHVATWAILYYITHLLKGAVLFITIVLIGTGWTFIKHILADKDKKLFMIVIPLQVLANVAEIIIAESEEGDIEHRTWRDIFILVDLLCCGAILFPVVWSIRHLQEASQTDGKAAVNLRKLKLFRHFYIMIVCYIYFTRIIVYLLKITVPFQYEWLDEMFREMATYVFFVVTGYKFRPASANPYFMMSSEEDYMDEVLTESGATVGLSKLTNRATGGLTIVESNEIEKDALLSKRESSHEYD